MTRFILITLLAVPVNALAAPRTNTPQMTWLEDGQVKLGVDLALGGAITYLSKSGSAENLINSWDWGRQVQMSYYAGPVPFTPNGKQPAPQWRGLGWNPVQAGDHFGNASKTLEHTNDAKTIYVKSVPMQWPLDNEPAECTFETWYAVDGPTVQVKARLTMSRADKTQWPARTQELPAVYTNGPFYKLMTYAGDKPFAGGDLTQIEHPLGKDGHAWATWRATEHWAALVNDDGFGLGVWNPDCYRFGGGFAGKPGKGGPKDGPTGYIAPDRDEILDHDAVHDYAYTLIVGDLKSIRDHVYARGKRPTPPDYRFDKDRQGWHYRNATDTGWPIKGELDVRLDGDDPQMVAPETFFEAADAPVLYVRAAFKTEQKTAQVFWATFGDKRAKVANLTITPDGEFRTYELRLADSPDWNGRITSLRFDPVPGAKAGEWVKVKSIGFARP